MSSINLTISNTDYQFSKTQTDNTTINRVTTGLETSSDDTDDLNKRIGPAYSVELSGNQDAAVLFKNESSSLQESESRIFDAVVAAEAAPLINLPTAQQSGIAALAQSGSAPKALLAQLKE
jgi:flagellin-like hook-associated protein FlgL